MRRTFLISAIVISHTFALQGQDYYEGDDLRYENHIYDENIKTVLFHPSSGQREFPVVQMGQRLTLRFDDLGADYTDYAYTLIHCNADWTPSNLNKSQYLDGYQEYFINDYDYSYNTFVPYTHYHLQIPNENIKPTISGNYLLVVFKDNGEEEVVITRRFMIYEEVISLSAEVKRATRVSQMSDGHEVDFTINHSNYDIPNPFQDLHVTLLQNQRWDNAITKIEPQFVQNGQLAYNLEEGNIFPGGNEYRYFDTKNIQVLSENMRRVEVENGVWTVYLANNQPRSGLSYATEPDINGQRVIRKQGAQNTHTEADYALVDFHLEMEAPVTNGNIYVFGALSDWEALPEFQLHYDEDERAYKRRILLKQGYYNYEYAAVRDRDREIDNTEIEGSHWQTENDYFILVYHREIGIRYDRLIGYLRLNSGNLN